LQQASAQHPIRVDAPFDFRVELKEVGGAEQARRGDPGRNARLVATWEQREE
jgi:hypothetical protein